MFSWTTQNSWEFRYLYNGRVKDACDVFDDSDIFGYISTGAMKEPKKD